MTPVGTRLFRRGLLVVKLRIEALPAVRFHELQIDTSRRLFAICHGIGNVRRASDQVASCVEARAAGFERESVDFNRAALLEYEAGGAAEVEIDRFTDGEDDRVAVESLDLIRW